MYSSQFFSLKESGLNRLLTHYLDDSSDVKPFYRFQPDAEGLRQCVGAYQSSFDASQRSILKTQLLKQAALVNNTTTATIKNIELLGNEKSFTITTGHQLCLFTGPLYFIYKILSVINLCEFLSEQNDGNSYVPVYWMASEDHDLEEIQSVNLFGKTVKWETAQTGAVGEMQTTGIETVVQELRAIVGENSTGQEVLELFSKAYTTCENLANATRYLVNALFGRYGVVVIDGNDPVLKAQFVPELEQDVFKQSGYTSVSKTIEELEVKGYPVQVNPRQINVFYMQSGIRARIEQRGDTYSVINTGIEFTQPELKEMLQRYPERFSPNVVLRPLYQQKILPNIAYIGGPGELTYWLEFKRLFETFNGIMPVLLPRHFITIADASTYRKIEKLGLQVKDFFKDEKHIIDAFMLKQEGVFDLEKEAEALHEVFNTIALRVENIDKSLTGTVAAERQKALNALGLISGKVNKSLKQRSEQEIKQIQNIKNRLFPAGTPQERFDNFLPYTFDSGINWINGVKEALKNAIPVTEMQVLVPEKMV